MVGRPLGDCEDGMQASGCGRGTFSFSLIPREVTALRASGRGNKSQVPHGSGHTVEGETAKTQRQTQVVSAKRLKYAENCAGLFQTERSEKGVA